MADILHEEIFSSLIRVQTCPKSGGWGGGGGGGAIAHPPPPPSPTVLSPGFTLLSIASSNRSPICWRTTSRKMKITFLALNLLVSTLMAANARSGADAETRGGGITE